MIPIGLKTKRILKFPKRLPEQTFIIFYTETTDDSDKWIEIKIDEGVVAV